MLTEKFSHSGLHAWGYQSPARRRLQALRRLQARRRLPVWWSFHAKHYLDYFLGLQGVLIHYATLDRE
ncbi:hypothetical protein N9M41_07655 [Rhodopirellula sp.]|nr:hypothetical protein [Rhodopirellula sp.]